MRFGAMRGLTRKLIWTAVLGAALIVAAGGAATAKRRPVKLRATSSALVVGLGDSLSSGEGNPDVPKDGSTPAQWKNRRCDRSDNSYEAQVADRLQKRNPSTNVKFVYLACSGASIPNGLLGPYAGVNPEYPKLPAQIDEARRLAGDRKADAVLLSIGVNDLEFGSVATFCATYENCPNKIYSGGLKLADWMKRELAQLPDRYQQLAAALKPLAPASRVFITEYPDLVSTSSTELCKLIYFRPGLVYGDYQIKAPDIDWLYHFFYLPLNKELADAAAKFGWTLVDAPPAFENHGYCTDDTWIVTYKQSQDRQGDANGTLHPNMHGQTAIADAFYPVVSKALDLPGRSRPGRPRPARPAGGSG